MNVLCVGASDETAERLEDALQRHQSRGTVFHARDVPEARDALGSGSIDCVVHGTDGTDHDAFAELMDEDYANVPVVRLGETSTIPTSRDTDYPATAEFVLTDLTDPVDRLAYRVQSAVARAESETDDEPAPRLDRDAAPLEALSRTTRALFAADTTDEVTDAALRAAEEILGVRANVVLLYDGDADNLQPISWTDELAELIGDPAPLGPGDSIAWRVFQTGESTAIDDVPNDPDVHNPETAVRSELHLPIEDRGILVAASPEPESFDRQDLELGELLAANLGAALDRVERLQDLKDREEELARQDERLEDFASVVSHDLRNPLTVATGRLELARRECDSDHLAGIGRAHDRMTALIEGIVTLARQEREPEELVEIDVEALVTSCWRTVATGDAELVVDLDDRPLADRQQLQQLFENLISNAVSHGGEDSTVTVGRLEDGFYLEDDGPGIDPEKRDRIFEVGYSTSPGRPGFGLSIVRQVVDAHDWEIRATEAPEGGARFAITGVAFAQE